MSENGLFELFGKEYVKGKPKSTFAFLNVPSLFCVKTITRFKLSNPPKELSAIPIKSSNPSPLISKT